MVFVFSALHTMRQVMSNAGQTHGLPWNKCLNTPLKVNILFIGRLVSSELTRRISSVVADAIIDC